ncbi:MAG: PTS sugar transporter subunit IIA [Treponema sp.]|nr:PTS sugar transporter subunit IIA [Treponema sp.]
MMTLTELINPELLLLNVSCSTKNDLIAQLAAKIYSADRKLPLSHEELLKNIYTREEIGGTLLPSGLVIPHARLKNFEDFILAVATPAAPLFQGKQEIRLAAMMITSQSGGAWYLETLAALTKLSRDEPYFRRLAGALTKEDFFSVLRESNLSFAPANT